MELASIRNVGPSRYGPDVNREWLARRIEIEAWAYANADHLTRDLCYGQVLGFLEVGTHAGYWSAKVADQVADSIQEKWGLKKVRRRLTR